ncbi:MAG: sigma-54 interaction domain-containing protein [Bacillota bacterium]
MKLKNNSLIHSNEVYKQILDSIQDDVFVTDANYKIIYMNEGCKRMYNCDPERDIGKTIFDLVDAGYYSPPLAPIIMEKKCSVTMEQMTCLGIKILSTGTPIFDEHGEVAMILFLSRDITELEALKYDVEETKKLLGHYEEEIRTMHRDELSLLNVVAQNQTVLDCFHEAKKIAKTEASVLLTGESGVDKNVFADFIHKVSNRRDKPFVQINCAAIPENLLESELFGYCAGAFSGADRKGKAGLVEIADKGTLFLDEIGELPLMLQSKLLQFVQEKTFIPVGGKTTKKVDVRLITATNQSLQKMVEERKFRQDLYYRLNVIEINLPPLRERQEDIPILCDHFLSKINSKYRTYGVLDPNIIPVLQKYAWPGNIRELEHVLERLVLTVDNDIISAKHLPQQIKDAVGLKEEPAEQKSAPSVPEETTKKSYREIEIEQILKLYEELHSSYKVAKELHISQSKATRIINKYSKAKKS